MIPTRRPRMSRPLTAIALISALGVAGIALPAHADTDDPRPAETVVGWADLVEDVSPAVVSVISTREAAGGGPDAMAPDGESPMERFMRRFFGDEAPEAPPMPEGRPMEGLGSGFLIDPDGLIVTNHHVIRGATRIEVRLEDGSSFEATVLGSDPHTDLAVLAIEPDKALPYVSFGDSDAVRVGDPVAAVGNPFGLGGTVTAGIVSALGRDIGAGPYDDFLQIDAAINRGNSGGPTFNRDGEVIGVNSAIFSPTGTHVGIGFAIPTNLARNVVEALREDGELARGWLGVQIQSIDEDLAGAIGLDEPQGALVADVTEGSPAEDAGMLRGDVILGFEDETIETMRDLPRLVADQQPGSTTEVLVWREGAEETLEVTLGRLPSEDELAAAPPAPAPVEPQLGMQLVPLTPDAREAMGLPEDTEGLVVAEVAPGSAAAEQGLQQGDVLLEVGGRTVSEPGEVADAARSAAEAGQESVLVLMRRGDQDSFVALPLAG
jgi:serine protease Do